MSSPTVPELLDIEEAAAFLGVNERWMRRSVAEQRIEFIRVVRLIRFRREALERYLADNTVGAIS